MPMAIDYRRTALAAATLALTGCATDDWVARQYGGDAPVQSQQQSAAAAIPSQPAAPVYQPAYQSEYPPQYAPAAAQSESTYAAASGASYSVPSSGMTQPVSANGGWQAEGAAQPLRYSDAPPTAAAVEPMSGRPSGSGGLPPGYVPSVGPGGSSTPRTAPAAAPAPVQSAPTYSASSGDSDFIIESE